MGSLFKNVVAYVSALLRDLKLLAGRDKELFTKQNTSYLQLSCKYISVLRVRFRLTSINRIR